MSIGLGGELPGFKPQVHYSLAVFFWVLSSVCATATCVNDGSECTHF